MLMWMAIAFYDDNLSFVCAWKVHICEFSAELGMSGVFDKSATRCRIS